MVHWPLLRTEVAKGRLDCSRFGPLREAHTFGEMFQLIEVLRGELSIPRALRHLAHLPQDLHSIRTAKQGFDGLDVLLLAPSSPVELVFRGISVNRAAVTRLVSDAARAHEDERVAKLLSRWMRVGLLDMKEPVRVEASTDLLKYIHDDSKDCHLSRALLAELRTFPSDILGGFRKARAMFSCPIGVVLYVFRYMPDGRAISWPVGFREEVLKSAAELNLPIFDPAPVVVSHGVDTALLPFRAHYRNEFLPVIGKAILEFAEQVYATATVLAERSGER
jgi:hypothetical protein